MTSRGGKSETNVYRKSWGGRTCGKCGKHAMVMTLATWTWGTRSTHRKKGADLYIPVLPVSWLNGCMMFVLTHGIPLHAYQCIPMGFICCNYQKNHTETNNLELHSSSDFGIKTNRLVKVAMALYHRKVAKKGKQANLKAQRKMKRCMPACRRKPKDVGASASTPLCQSLSRWSSTADSTKNQVGCDVATHFITYIYIHVCM